MNLTIVISYLLKKHPELRSDTQKLVWAVWYKMGYTDDLGMHITRENFYKAPSPESITRSKRRLSENL